VEEKSLQTAIWEQKFIPSSSISSLNLFTSGIK
jgi:hypothetical protein